MRKHFFVAAVFTLAASSMSVLGQPTPRDIPARILQVGAVEKKADDAQLPPPKSMNDPPPPEDVVVIFRELQPCGPYGCVWFNVDYLGWWTNGFRTPPLLTTSPPGTPFAQAGVLGQPGTSIVFGDSPVGGGFHSGARFTLGAWLNRDQTIGIEANGFFLGDRSTSFSSASAGDPILAIPFINATPGSPSFNKEASFKTGFPQPDPLAVNGSLTATTFSKLWGAEVNVRYNLYCDACRRIDCIGGFRFMDLHEGLTLNDIENGTLPPISFDLTDRFETRNRFYGSQLGLMCESWRGRYFLQMLGKVAIGCNDRTVEIAGSNNTVIFGVTQPTQGGLFAQTSNIGTYSSNAFAVVPEIGINVGYQINRNLRATAGYTFLYWSSVARPGDQMDRSINTTQPPLGSGLVGEARPAFQLRTADFWAQGINLGLEFRY